MTPERLWAPWRLDYVKGGGDERPAREIELPTGADPGCFLCRSAADDADRENLVALRTQTSLAILNRYPYNNGHLLIAPRRHVGRLDEMTPIERSEGIEIIARLVGVLERLLSAEGFNVGLNLGRAAGAGVPGHVHWHIVPRWQGDTNFMPVVAGAKVIPQTLDDLWQVLNEALRA